MVEQTSTLHRETGPQGWPIQTDKLCETEHFRNASNAISSNE